MPELEPGFIRRYVAYAKRVVPVLTPETAAQMKAKYLEVRRSGEGPSAPVPITPRQLGALDRFAEASARIRLSHRVEPVDADRAVRIMEYWMNRIVGVEGRFDIDIVQTGISHSQREQIIALRDVIQELMESSPGGTADVEDIVRAANDKGILAHDVDKWLKRWSEEGEIYSPAKNKYKLVEKL